MPKTMRAMVGWGLAAVLIVALPGVLLAEEGEPAAGKKADGKGLHGAAPTDAQMKALDELIPKATEVAPDRYVDAVLWDSLLPKDNETNDARIALGRKLYFEERLSADGTVSCATCHDSKRSFTDRRPVSEGINDQLGRRNAPTTMNAAYLQTQFWDGRAATLEDQAGQPILNPVEMGMPSRDKAVAAIKDDAEYKKMFQAAYGRDVNYDDIQRAIAAFERTLIFMDAPFDRFLAGDTSAISEDARKGWVLFNGKARCATCHTLNESYPLGTDNRFHNIGVAAHQQDFEKLAAKALVAMREDPSEQKLDELAVGTDLSELGRFMVTKNRADIGAFKTSQLRNIGITAPYMHDGSMQTLWDTVDHYNKGGEDNAWLDGGIESLALTEAEIDQLVALLFTLTDDRFSDLNAEEMARQKKHAAEKRPFRNTDQAMRKVLGFEPRVMGTGDAGGDKGDGGTK